MQLTRGQFTQFELEARMELLNEYGRFILARRLDNVWLKVYALFDFFVEVMVSTENEKISRCEPVVSQQMVEYYLSLNEMSD